jgi:CRP-like cAMP-binding protein/HEAT repeat protein
MSLMQRVLSPVVEVRKEESVGIVLMFAYSFLAMTSYNIIQPLTRSKLIESLGAVNVPWVILGSGLIISVLMLGYTRAVSSLPRGWALPITQLVMAAVMVVFWVLFTRGGDWVSIAFYVWGMLLGVLLISQFWTLANGVYDPRQAKRLFGFIGGGVMLGGMTGAGLTATLVKTLGTNTLLLCSAGTLVACAAIVTFIVRRNQQAAAKAAVGAADEERGVSLGRAFGLLRESRQIQLIAVVIGFGSLGAALIDQQLNMAAEVFKGQGEADAIGAFLAQVRFYLSAAAFVIQVWITPRIHKYLGIGFALLILPTNLGVTAAIILLNTALWAPAVASVLDRSFRYTVDKTTREVLFLPLPSTLRQEVKPFVDVTVDRLTRGFGALLMLLLIQPWGFALQWYQLSFVSLVLTAIWFVMAIRAKREYLVSFRRNLETRAVPADEVRLAVADLTTVEALVQELSHTQPARVVYAIDMLESIGKANLVTPLLLFHESPDVRERTLRAIGEARSEVAGQWVPQVRRALGDSHAGVRAAALRALGAIAHEDAATLSRPLLADPDPRIRATAAVALAASADADDIAAAETVLGDIVSSVGEDTRAARREVAAALGQVKDVRFQRLLIPLLYDPAGDVADEAMESVRRTGTADFIFVPALVSLLRNRHLKGRAREVLVSYGEAAIEPLAYFMGEEHEDVWIRRHLPSTIAMIPSQKAVDALSARLDDPDGFLRYKVMSALGRLRRADYLKFPADKVEASVLREGRQFFTYLSLHDNLSTRGSLDDRSMLATALSQKMVRGRDRIFHLLALIYPPADIAAAQWTIAHGDPRNRASASEYLDNLLTGPVRKMVMPVVEDLPRQERVRRGNVLIRTRPRDVEETLLQLINDDDQVISACAIDLVRQRRLWTLAGDIEHVLAHRDVRDWFVFEAASWALAEQRMPAERRREIWLEPLPAAVLASELRALPLFASVSIDELFRIAGAARQVRHEAGTTLLAERSVPDMLHVLLDGEVVVSGEKREPQTMTGPAAFGFIEALQSKPMRRTVRTLGTAVTLALTAEELRTQLAYNPELVRGLFATMAERAQKAGLQQVFATGGAEEMAQLAADGLQPVEKVLAIQRVTIFKHFSAEEARNLAAITQTVEMKEGVQLFQAADPPATWLIMSGEVQLEATAQHPAAIARGGDAIGSFGALAGPSIGQNGRVTRAGIALRIDRDDLFEMLGDRPEMLRQLFAGILEAPQPASAQEMTPALS